MIITLKHIGQQNDISSEQTAIIPNASYLTFRDNTDKSCQKKKKRQHAYSRHNVHRMIKWKLSNSAEEWSASWLLLGAKG